MDYFLIILAYISLFISIFWLQVMLVRFEEVTRKKGVLPSVSVLVPAFNEEGVIAETIKSLLNLDYPKEKLQLIVIDDGSTDRTADIVRGFSGVHLIQRKKNSGKKAAALNVGLKYATGEFIACLDADSTVEPDALKRLIQKFTSDSIGGVICAIKVKKPNTLIEKLQWFEYIMAAFIRKLMAKVHVLFITPGVLSVYRTAVVKKLGGFDEDNLTEDFEIALRLHHNHYDILIETKSYGYTQAPKTFYSLYQQRVRWFRGFIANSLKYHDMFFNRKYGLLGTFQLPLAVIAIGMLLSAFFYFGIRLGSKLFSVVFDLLFMKFDYFSLFELPSIRTLLGFDAFLWFPVMVTFMLLFYFMTKAHKEVKEKWKYPVTFPIYVLYFPLFQATCWTAAVVKEVFRTKRKW